ncbi:MarR family transcriptional regulator [Clostridium sp. YIM B02515]|uniref:MarR family transcriptional regulator n=1 Tax=Clostridium rhizosphaerae TaxID=2803861 RepID=A0ABS1TCF5_9CLOT|nr:MarR family transcriptional regulator [Clostridium rhizosphaerae]MBL4936442.1 MarR family transcriptional regulator [Clostridium rhizosphaerae]
MNINESFGYIINSTARNIKKQLETKIKIYDITTSQWAVLKVLSEEDNLTQAEVAEKLEADRATTGAVIDKLINKKLVYRNQCENDRRANIVCISDYGQDLAEKISYEAVKCNCRALVEFNDDEIEQLFDYLQRINNNLKKEGE